MNLLNFLNLGGGELILLGIVVFPFVLTIYCILDILKSDFKDSNSRLLFIIVVLIAPVIGALIYLFMRRNYVRNKFE